MYDLHGLRPLRYPPSVLDSPGLRLSHLLERATDDVVQRLLIPGAVEVIDALRPELLVGEKRAQTLSYVVDLAAVIEDPSRRALLLDAIPKSKTSEFESRIGATLAELRDSPQLNRDRRRALLGFLGQSTSSEGAPSTVPGNTNIEPRSPLFAHQKRAATAVERILYNNVPPRAMLHFPTGSGKTRTAMSIVASHLRVRTPGLILWLAETRELLAQATEEFEKTWHTVGDRSVQLVRFWGQHNPPVNSIEDGIILASLAKVRSYAKDRQRLWSLGDRTTLVVFDEAHHATARTYRDVVETLVSRGNRTGLLGLSATPGRTWNSPDEDAEVATVFGENKVTLDFGAGVNPVTHLIAEGYLASPTFSRLDVASSLSANEYSAISQSDDVPIRVMDQMYNDYQRNVTVIKRLLHMCRFHSRILVFTGTVRHALLVSRVCCAVGCHADVVTADTDTQERANAIARFNRPGRPSRLLVNVGVLTTGFDSPGATAALIDRPTRSLVLYSQMVGRVLRGPRAGGTERCEVVTIVDTSLPGFGDVADAFVNWEDVWGT